jgi:hypothetical protein
MEITPEIANRIREKAEQEALEFYVEFDQEGQTSPLPPHPQGTYQAFLDFLADEEEIPENCTVWRLIDFIDSVDLYELIENHAEHLENLMTEFLKGI